MNQAKQKPTLEGATLEAILTHLVALYGWEEMAKQVNIRCFTSDPSIKSSLKFLRKTPWAREKVEQMYLHLGER
ncbi:VF530 family DNA-binding protein [Undibacterium sp. Xuan67W]|uniref:VF530 family protein n=1 Tax=Undibacterium sp. Xuan67W TaxID=3413057 RepID=UPI003BF2580B